MRCLTIFRLLFIWLMFCCNWLAAQSGEAAKSDSLPPHLRLFEEAENLQDSGHFKESIPVLKKAIKQKKDYWEAMNLLAKAQMNTEKYKDALKSLDKAEAIAPMNYKSLKTRGIVQFRNQQFSESKRALDTAAFIAMEELIDDPE